MPTITARILQSTGLAASTGAIAARELGLTSDTERPVIGSTVGGAKYIGTEDIVNITTAAPAALPVLQRSRVLVFVDTATAGGHVNLDIQAGAQVAGYVCKVFVNGPDSRACAVTYGSGLVEYIPNGISQEFVWTGSAWVKTIMSFADKMEIGTLLFTDIEPTLDAKHPLIKRWEANQDISAANYPLAVPAYRAKKSATWSGSAWVTNHTVTVAGSVLTGSGTAWTNLLASLAEDLLVHGGSYTGWLSINVAGTDYAIANVNTGAGTITVTGSPATGTQTAIVYPHRIAGSTTTARLLKLGGRALMSPDGTLRIAGTRRRHHLQGHWHAFTYDRGIISESSTGAYDRVLSAPSTQRNDKVREMVPDGTNGTPITGPQTEPNSATAYLYSWAGVLL